MGFSCIHPQSNITMYILSFCICFVLQWSMSWWVWLYFPYFMIASETAEKTCKYLQTETWDKSISSNYLGKIKEISHQKNQSTDADIV